MWRGNKNICICFARRVPFEVRCANIFSSAILIELHFLVMLGQLCSQQSQKKGNTNLNLNKTVSAADIGFMIATEFMKLIWVHDIFIQFTYVHEYIIEFKGQKRLSNVYKKTRNIVSKLWQTKLDFVWSKL